MTGKPSVVEEANIEELVETNQLLTNVNNSIEPSTKSTDKVELIELSKDSYSQDSYLLTYFLYLRFQIAQQRLLYAN